jgi:hypothetical protein
MPVQPSTQALTNGQSWQFALVDAKGNPVAGATWSATPPGLVNLSPQGLVTAPPLVMAETNIIITATLPQGNPEQAVVRLVLLEVILVPDKVSLRDGEMQRFEATVPGDPANGVHWIISPALGNFDDGSHTYTAPPLNREDREVQVIATSAIDPRKRATATVQLESKPPWWGVTVGLFLYLVGIFSLVFLLVSLWPTGADSNVTVNTPLGTFSREVDLLWLVLISGALGSFAYGARSFVDFVGNRALRTSWSAWYVMYPFIGAALSLIFYLAVRGGFLTTTSSTKDVNVFGLTAISGLVGMFSKQATTKLGEVFSTMFKTEKDDQPLKNKLS